MILPRAGNGGSRNRDATLTFLFHPVGHSGTGIYVAEAVCKTSTYTWPHTFVVPKYATMGEYKQFAPANHFHMTWGLAPARLEYWMDMTNVLSVTPWQARPSFVEGVDRPSPLLHLINGGEDQAKRLLRK